MSRPKFQSREARECADLGLEPLGSPWSSQHMHKLAMRTAAGLPADARQAVLNGFLARRLGRLRHREYLHRTGGMILTDIDDVHLCWTCCGSEELLDDVHYDRHGELRPEDKARILALSYYHRCEGYR